MIMVNIFAYSLLSSSNVLSDFHRVRIQFSPSIIFTL